MPWTNSQIKALRKLWRAGDSARIIGHKLGVTKNSVIGKAHREGLQSRPSPIVRHKAISPKKYRTKREHFISRQRLLTREIRNFAESPIMGPIKVGRPKRISIIAPEGFKYKETNRKCQWIEGVPTGNDSCKCGAPAVLYPNNTRAPYCEKHVRRAWRPYKSKKKRIC